MEVKRQIFTGACFFCQTMTNSIWCIDCERDFIRERERCPVCAKRNSRNKICGSCLNLTPCFSNTEVLFDYRYPANTLIKTFKFNRRPELAKIFTDKLVEKLINKQTLLPDALIPVPLHKNRQRSRGYNQSLELARHLSKQLNIKLEESLSSRIKNTNPQSSLPKKNRRKNVKDAFSMKKKQVPGHVAIIDDVITTGSTINELARVFKKAGCQRIDVWAIARA